MDSRLGQKERLTCDSIATGASDIPRDAQSWDGPSDTSRIEARANFYGFESYPITSMDQLLDSGHSAELQV